VPCITFPQVAPVSVKEKILMLVVLGSRLAISCVLNHQSSSGSLTAFHLFPFEALGWVCVFRGQRNSKVQGRLRVVAPQALAQWNNYFYYLLTLMLSYLI
jgi:hypothetical protein